MDMFRIWINSKPDIVLSERELTESVQIFALMFTVFIGQTSKKRQLSGFFNQMC